MILTNYAHLKNNQSLNINLLFASSLDCSYYKIKPLTDSFSVNREFVEALRRNWNYLTSRALSRRDEPIWYCNFHCCNQAGLRVTFTAWSPTSTERKYVSIEKEASTTIEAVKRWSHYLSDKHFTIVTDQQAVNIRFNTESPGKF